jgi:hypothetical protein
LRLLLFGAEAVIDYGVLLVNASLHLALAAPRQKGEGHGCEQRSSDSG